MQKDAVFVLQAQDKGILHQINKCLCLTKFGIKSNIRLGAPAGYRSPSYPNKPNNKDKWDVAIYSPGIKILLSYILPLLKHEKRKLDATKVKKSIKEKEYAR